MTRISNGWVNGFIGVLIFSASLPATKMAVADFDPVFLTLARASIAGLLGLLLLGYFRVSWPARSDMFPLAVVALGVVVGFPLLTAMALRHLSSAHSIVFIGLLPLMTAIFAVLRAGERPPLAFWLFSGLGSLLVAGFAFSRGLGSINAGDGLMLAAIAVCGLGYAEGASLARKIGGWQVICWALVLSLPVMAPLALFTAPRSWSGISLSAVSGLAYVSVFSMLIGFVFLVPGVGAGRHCGCWAAPASAAIFRACACGLAARRTGDISHDYHCWCRCALRHRGKARGGKTGACTCAALERYNETP